MKQNTPLIITISRQLGSGGAYIGQELAKRLNFYYADREIINKASLQFSVSAEELTLREEKQPSFWDYVAESSFVAPGVYIPPRMIVSPTSSNLFEAEKEIIERIAEESHTVIIGRCGFHIFRGHPNCVKIFLYAGNEFRTQRVSKLYNVSEKRASEMISESDRERTAYCKAFTGKEWANATNYDISINTGKTGIDKTHDFILDYLKQTGLL